MGVLFNRQVYFSGGLPSAPTEKVTLLPAVTLWLAGWLVMLGAWNRVTA